MNIHLSSRFYGLFWQGSSLQVVEEKWMESEKSGLQEVSRSLTRDPELLLVEGLSRKTLWVQASLPANASPKKAMLACESSQTLFQAGRVKPAQLFLGQGHLA